MGNREVAKSIHDTSVSVHRPNLDKAWCVPLLASISTFLLTMPFTCFGLLFVIIEEKFGTTREETSWIESVFIMCSNLSALAIAFLQLRFTLSHIALLAAVMTCTAVIASAFAPNVIWMSIVFGGAYGFAVKLFVAAVSIYTMLYFDKYRATAQSFISSSQGAAGMAGQSLLLWLEKSYGFAGALVVLGGILLHAVPLTMLLNEPRGIGFTCFRRRKSSAFDGNIVVTPAISRSSKSALLKSAQQRKFSEVQGSAEQKLAFGVVNNNSITREKAFSSEVTCAEAKSSSEGAMLQESSAKNSPSNFSITRSESLFPLKTAPKTPLSNLGPKLNTSPNRMVAPKQSCSLKIALSLFKEPAFYVLLVGFVVGDYTEIVFLATAVEYAQDKSVSVQKSEQLVTLWFLGQFLGSGLLPLLADCVGHSRSIFYVVTFALSSVSLVVLPHVMDIPSLSVVLPIHGMAMGFIRCVKCVVIADQVGPERTAACWGISGLAIIPLSLANPMIIGFFRDSGGSYDNFYRMLGGINFFVMVQLAVFLVCSKKENNATVTAVICTTSTVIHEEKAWPLPLVP
ncbi:monocarboxylate transporter 9-like [Dermacentor silvarum]|uniref:monocarboxylate transporter 9-like n=1 Tax=Dermacentor silvarum TaxID=543639 RepID=UPI0021012EF5|nr:monocarboxylate transporter 9-like [Dermacentor silvarum]